MAEIIFNPIYYVRLLDYGTASNAYNVKVATLLGSNVTYNFLFIPVTNLSAYLMVDYLAGKKENSFAYIIPELVEAVREVKHEQGSFIVLTEGERVKQHDLNIIKHIAVSREIIKKMQVIDAHDIALRIDQHKLYVEYVGRAEREQRKKVQLMRERYVSNRDFLRGLVVSFGKLAGRDYIKQLAVVGGEVSERDIINSLDIAIQDLVGVRDIRSDLGILSDIEGGARDLLQFGMIDTNYLSSEREISKGSIYLLESGDGVREILSAGKIVDGLSKSVRSIVKGRLGIDQVGEYFKIVGKPAHIELEHYQARLKERQYPAISHQDLFWVVRDHTHLLDLVASEGVVRDVVKGSMDLGHHLGYADREDGVYVPPREIVYPLHVDWGLVQVLRDIYKQGNIKPYSQLGHRVITLNPTTVTGYFIQAGRDSQVIGSVVGEKVVGVREHLDELFISRLDGGQRGVVKPLIVEELVKAVRSDERDAYLLNLLSYVRDLAREGVIQDPQALSSKAPKDLIIERIANATKHRQKETLLKKLKQSNKSSERSLLLTRLIKLSRSNRKPATILDRLSELVGRGGLIEDSKEWFAYLLDEMLFGTLNEKEFDYLVDILAEEMTSRSSFINDVLHEGTIYPDYAHIHEEYLAGVKKRIGALLQSGHLTSRRVGEEGELITFDYEGLLELRTSNLSKDYEVGVQVSREGLISTEITQGKREEPEGVTKEVYHLATVEGREVDLEEEVALGYITAREGDFATDLSAVINRRKEGYVLKKTAEGESREERSAQLEDDSLEMEKIEEEPLESSFGDKELLGEAVSRRGEALLSTEVGEKEVRKGTDTDRFHVGEINGKQGNIQERILQEASYQEKEGFSEQGVVGDGYSQEGFINRELLAKNEKVSQVIDGLVGENSKFGHLLKEYLLRKISKQSYLEEGLVGHNHKKGIIPDERLGGVEKGSEFFDELAGENESIGEILDTLEVVKQAYTLLVTGFLLGDSREKRFRFLDSLAALVPEKTADLLEDYSSALRQELDSMNLDFIAGVKQRINTLIDVGIITGSEEGRVGEIIFIDIEEADIEDDRLAHIEDSEMLSMRELDRSAHEMEDGLEGSLDIDRNSLVIDEKVYGEREFREATEVDEQTFAEKEDVRDVYVTEDHSWARREESQSFVSEEREYAVEEGRESEVSDYMEVGEREGSSAQVSEEVVGVSEKDASINREIVGVNEKHAQLEQELLGRNEKQAHLEVEVVGNQVKESYLEDDKVADLKKRKGDVGIELPTATTLKDIHVTSDLHGVMEEWEGKLGSTELFGSSEERGSEGIGEYHLAQVKSRESEYFHDQQAKKEGYGDLPSEEELADKYKLADFAKDYLGELPARGSSKSEEHSIGKIEGKEGLVGEDYSAKQTKEGDHLEAGEGLQEKVGEFPEEHLGSITLREATTEAEIREGFKDTILSLIEGFIFGESPERRAKSLEHLFGIMPKRLSKLMDDYYASKEGRKAVLGQDVLMDKVTKEGNISRELEYAQRDSADADLQDGGLADLEKYPGVTFYDSLEAVKESEGYIDYDLLGEKEKEALIDKLDDLAQGLMYDYNKDLIDQGNDPEFWSGGFGVPEDYDPYDPFNAYHPWSNTLTPLELAQREGWQEYGEGEWQIDRNTGKIRSLEEGDGGVYFNRFDSESYRFRVDFIVEGGQDKGVGFIFKYKDQHNYYKFLMHGGDMGRSLGMYNPMQLYKVVDGETIMMGSPMQPFQWRKNQSHTFEVTVLGERITIKVDGRTQYELVES